MRVRTALTSYAIAVAVATLLGSRTAANAEIPTATQPIPAQFSVLSPTNLRQPINAAECLSHVPNGGLGFFEHDAFGCSHPTAGYVTLIWDWSGQADGFHIYRVDGQRQDYGIHKDGTMEFVHSTGFECFVIAAVRGSNESHDSNRYCIVPTLQRIQSSYTGPMQAPAKVVARLRVIGFEASDPNLAMKLRKRLSGTEGAYLALHRAAVLRIKPVGSLPPAKIQSGHTGPTNPVVPQTLNSTAPSTKYVFAPHPNFIQAPNTIVKVYDTHGNDLGPTPELRKGSQYFFLVSLQQLLCAGSECNVVLNPVAPDPFHTFTLGSIQYSLGCVPKAPPYSLEYAFRGDNGAENIDWHLPLLKDLPPYAYVNVAMGTLPVGHQQPAQVSLSWGNVSTSSFNVVLDPDAGSATMDITITSTPAVATNSYRVGASNAALEYPGTVRVGAGDWSKQTSGDDLIGSGITLEPGWKVTGGSIISANSTTSPTDFSPDNTWRGALVTTPPTSDMRTIVHWHYSGIDSLTYTLEWTLTGPMGQRPISTMAKIGSCDT